MPPDDLLSTSEAAQILGKSVPTVNRWADEGKIATAHKLDGIRGARLFRRADLDAFKDAHTGIAGDAPESAA